MLAGKYIGSLDLNADFKTLATDLVMLLSAEGVKVHAFNEGTPYFKALSFEAQQEVMKYLKFYYDLCCEHIQEGMSLRDNQTFTWRALKSQRRNIALKK